MVNTQTNRSILITGGAGFIGSNFVRKIIREGFERVVVVDKLTYAGTQLNLYDLADHPALVFVQADIGDRAKIDKVLETHQPAAIVNLASETHVDRSIDGPTAFIQTNVVGTFELLEAAKNFYSRASSDFRSTFRFLHVSTDEVYGTLGTTGLFSEKSAYDPNSPYAASKAGADHLVHAYHKTYGLPVLLTNCSNNYGPFQFPEKLIPLVILNAIEGRPLPVYGDGGQVRDWIFVEDHCDGIFEVLTRGQVGERYNIGANEERINLDVVSQICSVLEEFLPASENPALREKNVARYQALISFVQDRPGHDRRYAIDAGKIKKELGWQPRHNFDAGIRKTIRWYLDHRDWCEEVQSGKYQRERLGLSNV